MSRKTVHISLVVIAFLFSSHVLAGGNGTFATYSGTAMPICLVTTRVQNATFTLLDTNNDGFVEKLSAEDKNHRLQYLLQCNGAKVTISFGHPQQISGPAVSSNTRYYTLLATSRDGSKSISGIASKQTTDFIIQKNKNTTPQDLFIYFTLRNGGDNNIPLLAGKYTYYLRTVITASL